MNIQGVLEVYPDKRIAPFDGLAVTAEIWDAAHEDHRRAQRLHNILYHTPGIIAGLEVIADDPPDVKVSVLPGVAVDAEGRTIVLRQQVAYEIGEDTDGLLYLLLGYAESKPRPIRGSQGDGPYYVHPQFSIAASSVLSSTPKVELARIYRSSRQASIRDARVPAQPGLDEIDLRFRREVGVPSKVGIAVSYLGGVHDKRHGRGALHLAQALSHTGPYPVMVSDDVEPSLETNSLLYLVGRGAFELSASQTDDLVNYVKGSRGTLLVESVDAQAEASFLELLKTMDLEPSGLSPDHPVLLNPYLFAVPPPGFEPQDAGKVLVSEGVIFSTCNYGLLWAGETRNGPPLREQIRSALEWGGNIVDYAHRRRRQR